MLSVNLQSLPPWRSQLYCAHISYSLGRSILRTVTDDGVPGGANGLGLEDSNISFRLELRRGRMRLGGRWRWMGTERSRLGSESVSGRAWLADIFSYVCLWWSTRWPCEIRFRNWGTDRRANKAHHEQSTELGVLKMQNFYKVPENGCASELDSGGSRLFLINTRIDAR